MLSVNFKVLDIGACSTTFKVCSFPDYDIVIANCYHDLKSELMSTIFRKLYLKIHSFLSIVSCGVLMVCSLVSAWMLECSSGTDSHWFCFSFLIISSIITVCLIRGCIFKAYSASIFLFWWTWSVAEIGGYFITKKKSGLLMSYLV